MEILQKIKVNLYINAAPLVDVPSAFEGYMHIIRELTNSAKQTLHIVESKLSALLAPASNDMVTTAKEAFERHPAVTALGFAVSQLEIYSYDPGQQALVDRINAELEYDLHDGY